MTSASLVRVADPPASGASSPAGRGWIELMVPAAELAREIANTDFVPKAMRNNAPAIAAAILYGDEVGLGPMQSLAKIAVIEGKPTLTAEAQRALVYAAGHDLWLEEMTSTAVTWAGSRAGSDKVTRVRWTMDDARRAKLHEKFNWRNYPRQMLSARSSAELVRAIFADVVGGLAAVEELEGDRTDGDVPTDSQGTAGGSQRRSRGKAAAGVTAVPVARPPATDDAALPPLPGDADPTDPPAGAPDDSRLSAETHEQQQLITAAQHRHMMGLFVRAGYGRANAGPERERRLALIRLTIGSDELQSSKELTTAEADRVIAYLETQIHDEPDRPDEPTLPLDGEPS